MSTILGVLMLSALGGWGVWCMMKKLPRGLKGFLSLLAALALFATTKVLNNPNSSPQGNGQGATLVNPNHPGNGIFKLFSLPWWYQLLGWSSEGFDEDHIPDAWRTETYGDPSTVDSAIDRDGDGLTDWEEFMAGTNPRAFSTSGGIISDKYLVDNELDPLLIWDNEDSPWVIPWGEAYKLGLNIHQTPLMDFKEWIDRGLLPGEDEWEDEPDGAGDITRVGVRVTGKAAGSALVAIGPIRHVGSREQVYTLRSGRSYGVEITSLKGNTGMDGVLEIRPVVGMITCTNVYTHAFTLGAGGPSPAPQGGGGFKLMSAPAGDNIPPVHTWKLMLVPENEGCIHGRLKLVVQVQKGYAGLFAMEPGRYSWRWTDKDPLGITRNLTNGVAEVQITKQMAVKWETQYGKHKRRELTCMFTPEGETTVVTGRVDLACCGKSALDEDEVIVDEDEDDYINHCACKDDFRCDGVKHYATKCRCRESKSCYEACEACQQGATWCEHCYETESDCHCYCHHPDPGGEDDDDDDDDDDDGDDDGDDDKRPKHEWPLPWKFGYLYFNNDDDLKLKQEDHLTTSSSNKTIHVDHDIVSACIGTPQEPDCCLCQAHTVNYELKIISKPDNLNLLDEAGNEVSVPVTYANWQPLFVEAKEVGGTISTSQILWQETKNGAGGVQTNKYVSGRVSLFGDVNEDGILDMSDFWEWPRDLWQYVPVHLSVPEQWPVVEPSIIEAYVARKVGLGMWMETTGAAYTLSVKGNGVFEVWDNWTGPWRLTTKTKGAPFTFTPQDVQNENLKQVVVLCREKGNGWLELKHANSLNKKHNGYYGANLMLRGYDVLAIDSDNNNVYDLPDNKEDETRVRNLPDTPGKLAIRNDHDVDRDGILDYGDGFAAKSGDDCKQSEGVRFYPVVLSIPPVRPATNYNVAVIYNASNPATVTFDVNGKPVLPGGRLRLWKKDGGEIRSSQSIRQGGDFIPSSSTPFPATELGFSDSVRAITFYLEAVANSTGMGDETLSFSVTQPTHPNKPPTIFSSAKITIQSLHNTPDLNKDGVVDEEDARTLAKHRVNGWPVDVLYASASNVFHRVDLVLTNAFNIAGLDQRVQLFGEAGAFRVYINTNAAPVAVSSPDGAAYAVSQNTTTANSETTVWVECLQSAAGAIHHVYA